MFTNVKNTYCFEMEKMDSEADDMVGRFLFED